MTALKGIHNTPEQIIKNLQDAKELIPDHIRDEKVMERIHESMYEALKLITDLTMKLSNAVNSTPDGYFTINYEHLVDYIPQHIKLKEENKKLSAEYNETYTKYMRLITATHTETRMIKDAIDILNGLKTGKEEDEWMERAEKLLGDL